MHGAVSWYRIRPRDAGDETAPFCELRIASRFLPSHAQSCTMRSLGLWPHQTTLVGLKSDYILANARKKPRADVAILMVFPHLLVSLCAIRSGGFYHHSLIVLLSYLHYLIDLYAFHTTCKKFSHPYDSRGIRKIADVDSTATKRTSDQALQRLTGGSNGPLLTRKA